MSLAASIYEALNAIDANITGVAVIRDLEYVAESHWYVVTRVDGIRIRVETVDDQPPAQAAQNAVLAFDVSDAAELLREAARNPERKTLREQAAAAVTANDAFLALAAPTTAQVLQQVKRLTMQNTAIIKRLVQID